MEVEQWSPGAGPRGARAPARRAVPRPRGSPGPDRRPRETRAGRHRRCTRSRSVATGRTSPARRLCLPLPVAPRRCPPHLARRTGRPRTRPRRAATGARHPPGVPRRPATSGPPPAAGRRPATPCAVQPRSACRVSVLAPQRPATAARRGRKGEEGLPRVRRVLWGHVARRLADQRCEVCAQQVAIETPVNDGSGRCWRWRDRRDSQFWSGSSSTS